MNNLFNNIEGQINKYIETELIRYNADLTKKFDENILFNEEIMEKKIKSKLNKCYFQDCGYINYTKISDLAFIDKLIKFLNKYNIIIYFGYLNNILISRQYDNTKRLEFYTNTNIKIFYSYTFNVSPYGHIELTNNDNIRISFSIYNDSIDGRISRLSNEEITVSPSDEEKLKNVLKYINPNIYADYLLCCEENEIRGILTNRLIDNEEIKVNKEKYVKLVDLHNKLINEYNDLLNENNKLEETLINKLGYDEEKELNEFIKIYDNYWEVEKIEIYEQKIKREIIFKKYDSNLSKFVRLEFNVDFDCIDEDGNLYDGQYYDDKGNLKNYIYYIDMSSKYFIVYNIDMKKCGYYDYNKEMMYYYDIPISTKKENNKNNKQNVYLNINEYDEELETKKAIEESLKEVMKTNNEISISGLKAEERLQEQDKKYKKINKNITSSSNNYKFENEKIRKIWD